MSFPTFPSLQNLTLSDAPGAPTLKPAPKPTDFGPFVFTLLKRRNPGMGISRKAMAVIQSILNDTVHAIADEAGRLCRYNKRATMTQREIKTSVRLQFGPRLTKGAISRADDVLAKYMENTEQAEEEEEEQNAEGNDDTVLLDSEEEHFEMVLESDDDDAPDQ